MAAASTAYIVQGCAHGVDPRLLLGISLAETEGGKTGTGRPSNGYGAFGVGPGRHYPSYRAAIADAARILGRYYVGQGLRSVSAIERKWVGYASTDWLRTVTWAVRSLGGKPGDVRARCVNPPTKEPPRIGPVKAHGRVVNQNCAHRTLVLNDRGRCVRALRFLLTAPGKPAVRPAKKAHGANHDRHYWRVLSSVRGAYGHGAVKAVQRIKWRLGFAPGQANGAAGTKLRRYLLGTLALPASYRSAEANRFQAWKASHGKGAKLKAMLADASYLLNAASRYHYTRAMTGPNGRMSLLLNHPRGPPIAGELYSDCSGGVEALYVWNHFPDPAGPGAWQHYPSAAVYTGTQVQHGRLVWRPGQSYSRIPIGSLVFYGSPPTFHHVTMYLGNGRVWSMGSEAGPFNNSIEYRDDTYEARVYR